MSESNITNSTVEFTEKGKPKLPSGLNTLTILTFIGSGLGLIYLLMMPVINKFFLDMMEKGRTSGKEFTAKELTDMEKGKALIELTQANIIPIMTLGIIGILLCIVGAIWMRKLKKDGFWIYTAGELLPLIGSFIILGTAQYTGVFSIIIGVGLPLLFVILYANQRKYLK